MRVLVVVAALVLISTSCSGLYGRHFKKKRGVPIAADLKHTPCAPNDRFVIECNQCNCNAERTGYICTENICPSTSPKPKTDILNVTTDSNNQQNGLNGQKRSLEHEVTNTGHPHDENNPPAKANGRQQRNDEVREPEEAKSTIGSTENAQVL